MNWLFLHKAIHYDPRSGVYSGSCLHDFPYSYNFSSGEWSSFLLHSVASQSWEADLFETMWR